MYKRILVPLDGSTIAEQVLPYASAFAKALGAEVTMLRCIEPVSSELTTDPEGNRLMAQTSSLRPWSEVSGELSTPPQGVFLDHLIHDLLARAKDYLEVTSKPVRDSGIAISHAVHEGDPASRIVDLAAEELTTLIAISTRGRSGITRWVLGSVTSKVLEATDNPMLVIHPVEGGATRGAARLANMVVPLDGSKTAEQILPHAVAVARAMNLGVVLVRVTPTPSDYYRYMEYPAGRFQDFSKEVDQEAERYLQDLNAELNEQGVARVSHRLMHGQPAVAVIEVAKEVPNAMAAMTTHGRTGVGRWVLGSVADRVVRHTGVPVLLIRAKDEQV
ncbi:MAG: universal stress protein [Chloroflexi bacterium]|nr:universal stress protein [Chloroflexota bacterium]